MLLSYEILSLRRTIIGNGQWVNQKSKFCCKIKIPVLAKFDIFLAPINFPTKFLRELVKAALPDLWQHKRIQKSRLEIIENKILPKVRFLFCNKLGFLIYPRPIIT